MPSIKVARSISISGSVKPTPTGQPLAASTESVARSIQIGFSRKMQASSLSVASRVLPY